ncbi:MAG TPA: flagellar biosynthesis anti-sigma factor FlgM [Candidatus Sulfotelmatobacter sp.]|nr:flagellar biosynthesis anti-sigma factor FlgM [Candidatus Sulfotelmatobacter sp.]
MIISRAEIRSALTAYRAVKRKNTVATVAFDTADSFERSEAAQSLAASFFAATMEPFYRPELVSDLQRRIAEGKYYVPAEEIVDKLLGRLIVEAAAAAAG